MSLGLAKVLDKFHDLVFKFANSNHQAVRSIASPQGLEFREMISLFLSNAQTLKNTAQRALNKSDRKFTSKHKDNYEMFIASVLLYVAKGRSLYLEHLKRNPGLISILHNIWDSSTEEVLGVRIFFWHPVHQMYFMLPVSLMHITEKKVVPAVEAKLEVLERFVIAKPDLFMAVNDTTVVALKIGDLLVGENVTCQMHEVYLIMEHDTGMEKRKTGGKVSDSFDEFEKVRKA